MISTFYPPGPLQTAVLLLVFNRPETTARVFEAIRQAKPPRLYVAADGPREGLDSDTERCKKVRDIVTVIDWPCEVKTLFRRNNLGCKYAVSGAITWFFEHESQGIILEDDCLPRQSFFWFCEELLNRYAQDTRVFLISGYNTQGVWSVETEAYFFSNFGSIWGWASWSRAWSHYDAEMTGIENFIKRNHFVNSLGKKIGCHREREMLKQIILGKIDTWDYQFGYARLMNHGLAVVPHKNLITNIGFAADATHTTKANKHSFGACDINLPLPINKFLVPDRKYDEKSYNISFLCLLKNYVLFTVKKAKGFLNEKND